MNVLSRFAGVFFEPGKVFADIAERPSFAWVPPMVVAILMGVGFSYAVSTHIGWEQIVRKTLVNNPRAADLTPEQREQAVERGAKFGGAIAWVGAVVGPPFFTMIIAGILTGLFNAMLGTDLKFSTMFSISAYAFLIRGLYSILLILIMYLKPPEEFDIQLSPFSIGGYLNRQETPKWLFSLAGSIDLFTIWTIVVLAIGFSVASKKLSFTKSLTAIAAPWLLWVVALMALQSFS
jgi:hypothetical protein